MKNSVLPAICVFLSVSLMQAQDADSSTTTNAYDFHGTHFLASYKECDETALRNIDALRYAVIMAAHESNAKVLSHQDFRFSGDGYTMVVLLSESHASIHTYPEHGACFIDLFTCGNNCSWEKFHESLQKYLTPKQVEQSVIDRR